MSSLELWCALSLEAWSARLGASGSAVRKVGMGPVKATAFAKSVPAEGPAPVVLGIAGALGEDLALGDVVVADRLLGPEEGQVEYDLSAVAPGVVAALERSGIAARAAPIVCVDHIVTGSERAELAARQAVAVEMESWWLMSAQRPPQAVVRIISDTPSQELMSLALPVRLGQVLRRLKSTVPALESWTDEPLDL